ncbi:hypothetical protein CSUI_001358 [Cystoisospora suis]|uniref:Uncharacterized protein n=1 Tax=Cystoisospora suis TaxID=483139 RepID=A0A2C6LC02_9APIC|nr:hypothetical protein CSUI_001358 [Cystoisospora suis]
MHTAVNTVANEDERSPQTCPGASRSALLSPSTAKSFTASTPQRGAVRNGLHAQSETPSRLSTVGVAGPLAAQDASVLLQQNPHQPFETRSKSASGSASKRLSEMRQAAARLRSSLEKDTTRCIDSDRQRLYETLEQLQPEADLIKKLVEETHDMKDQSRLFASKRQQNLHLIERLKEEDKAIDEELKILPEKLGSLVAYGNQEKAALEAIRNEYRLVQKQRDHALHSWEEKIRIYEKTLGIRICQQGGAGGPTTIKFYGIMHGAAKTSRPGPESQENACCEPLDAGQASSGSQYSSERCTCFFEFSLNEAGMVTGARCSPPVERFDALMEAFGQGEISLPVVVACMRRNFKDLQRQQEKSLRSHHTPAGFPDSSAAEALRARRQLQQSQLGVSAFSRGTGHAPIESVGVVRGLAASKAQSRQVAGDSAMASRSEEKGKGQGKGTSRPSLFVFGSSTNESEARLPVPQEGDEEAPIDVDDEDSWENTPHECSSCVREQLNISCVVEGAGFVRKLQTRDGRSALHRGNKPG